MCGADRHGLTGKVIFPPCHVCGRVLSVELASFDSRKFVHSGFGSNRQGPGAAGKSRVRTCHGDRGTRVAGVRLPGLAFTVRPQSTDQEGLSSGLLTPN
jgi:hypothetical protein